MRVAGYASTPDLDLYRHVVARGAFDESIAQKGLTGPTGIRLLHQHEHDRVLGAIKVLEQRTGGLWIEAEIDEAISYGRDVAAMVRATGGLNFSVGFFLIDAAFAEDSFGDEYLYITRGELTEVSVVTFPGNSKARMTDWSDE
jgi:HK97 family phage prohead protease